MSPAIQQAFDRLIAASAEYRQRVEADFPVGAMVSWQPRGWLRPRRRGRVIAVMINPVFGTVLKVRRQRACRADFVMAENALKLKG